ncbi:MAG: ATP-binding protein [Phycisphaerae bacterium]
MARKFVKISLATKLRLVFGWALVGIIAAALLVPWYFMEQLADQGSLRPAEALTRLACNEFIREHSKQGVIRGREATSQIAALNAGEKGGEGPEGPTFIAIGGALTRDDELAKASFERNAEREVKNIKSEDGSGKPIYRSYRAIRAENSCLACHDSTSHRPFTEGQLAGMVEVTMPGSTASGALVWMTRASFIIGGVLGSVLALVLFAFITQRLILRPIRRLRELSDKVAEGDMSVRSQVKTGDELQRLGDSFNEMLTAINDQHEKLRSANRALDLKLSELAEANVTLFKANQVKSEFLANVSHELRTPLNSILGFADLVAENPDEKISRYGQNIASSAKSLLNMINDILDLARIEAGKAEVRFDKVNVTDTVQTLVALMTPLADKKKQSLTAELAGDVPIIITDGGKVQQILYNLLSNAIKFTPPGGRVWVRTSREAIQRDGRRIDEVSVAVADTGPGIAEADQQHIFEKFHRLDQGLTRESSGAGLGLSISKELTALIGARLTVKSEVGHGATFTLAIPAEPKVAGEAE